MRNTEEYRGSRYEEDEDEEDEDEEYEDRGIRGRRGKRRPIFSLPGGKREIQGRGRRGRGTQERGRGRKPSRTSLPPRSKNIGRLDIRPLR